MARWENEKWTVQHPDAEKIPCGDCVFRDPDRFVNGKLVCKGATLSTCKVFPGQGKGGYKETNILFYGADCDYYVSEKEDADE